MGYHKLCIFANGDTGCHWTDNMSKTAARTELPVAVCRKLEVWPFDNVALFRLFPAFHKFLLLLMKAAYFSVTGAGVGILQNALRNSTVLQGHVM